MIVCLLVLAIAAAPAFAQTAEPGVEKKSAAKAVAAKSSWRRRGPFVGRGHSEQ
jgi:hypothetical protein